MFIKKLLDEISYSAVLLVFPLGRLILCFGRGGGLGRIMYSVTASET